MKLTVILLFGSLIAVSASTYSQNTKLNLSTQNSSLIDIFRQIEDQSEFYFYYKKEEVKSKELVSVDLKDALVADVLDQVLNKTGLEYKIIDRYVVVKEKGSADPEVVMQQERKISGKVTDPSGAPIPGTAVVVKGTTTGITTNVDGNFSLVLPADAKILVISFVGMKTQEITIENQSTFNVVLTEETIGIEEVVAIGYGTQRKETLTGSISKVGGGELAKSPALNISSNLAGKLPGLIVNQRTGYPGDEMLDIVIRGNATFDLNPNDGINPNSALVVIDGVPRDNILERLNPDDIESVTVLKDASAAIYGARAANGVILVTTKQGSQGSPKFSLSYSYGITNPTKIPDMMDAVLFATVYNEGEYYRQGRPASGFVPFYTEAAIQKYRDGSDPILYPNTNWPAMTIKKNPYQQRLNFQGSGGSKNIRYLLSFGMTDQVGNFVNRPDSYKQYNARVRVDVDLTKNLTVGANIGAILGNRSKANGTDFVTTLQADPTLVAVYPNGLISPGRFNNNPLLSNLRGYKKTLNDPINTTFTATYKVPFVKGLTLDASFNYDLRNQFEKNLSKPYTYHRYNVVTKEYDAYTSVTPVELTDVYSRWTNAVSNFRISYKTTIAENHNISAMVGTEQQKQTYSYAMAYRKNFVSAAIPQINVGSSKSTDLNNGGSASDNAYNNFFGRVNYNFKSKYLFEFVFRYDGSQIFPEGKRYGFFPAISAGWRLSEEKFIKDNLSFVSELKLRGSYGELGNDRVNAYQYMQAFQFGNNFVFGGSDASGIYSSTMPNPNITWEVSKKLDFGMDASLWNGLLGTELSVFNENRSNILLQRNLSVSKIVGFPSLPDQNIGEVKNHGFELALTHRNTIGELKYSVNGNVSFARSKIIFMDETPPGEAYMAQTGHPLGSGLYYKSDGIFNTQAELDNFPHSAGTEVGDIKVLDLNDDGEINGNDRYMSKNSPMPEYVFGLTTNLQYKGFDLNLFFQGQTNAYSYDGTFDNFGLQDMNNGYVARATNRWTINNQEGATLPRANNWQPGTTDFFLYDATFVRLKSAELGYTLPANILSRTGIKEVRFYVNGTNLLTWAKEIKWRDPEISYGNFGENDYPPLRVFSFGVNVKF